MSRGAGQAGSPASSVGPRGGPATRVLLFVQTDGLPKCVRRGTEAERVAALFARDEARNAAYPEHTDHVPPYWLVECENAEAGRWTLLKLGLVRGPLFPTSFPVGRILASGGRP